MKSNIVDQIEKKIADNYPRLGVNKRQEIVRLSYEIIKREKLDAGAIDQILDEKLKRFVDLKAGLLKRRYAECAHFDPAKIFLPPIKVNPASRFQQKSNFQFYPKIIYYDQRSKNTPLLKRFQKAFPAAQAVMIPSYAALTRQKKWDIFDYHQRHEKVFILHENFDFLSRCPCTKQAKHCGYHILNLGVGCIFECAYCYLQGYINSPGLIFPSNVQDYISSLQGVSDLRMGTGQYADSLALEHITHYAKDMIACLHTRHDLSLEFKTKSNNVTNLLNEVDPIDNICFSWSLNPQCVIDRVEFYTASLKERLAAAKQCVEKGFRVGFHFDPIIYYQGWEEDYRYVIQELFACIPGEKINLMSLGCLRFTAHLKNVMENRFPDLTYLYDDFILGYDNKLRYSYRKRLEIYTKMKNWILQEAPDVNLYLCMENQKMHRALELSFQAIKINR